MSPEEHRFLFLLIYGLLCGWIGLGFGWWIRDEEGDE